MDLTVSTFLFCLLFAGICGQSTGPKDPGTSGPDPGVRYYYAKGTCYPFQYNGQGGNSNNHFSEAACRCTCLNDATACALAPPNPAVCRKDLERGTCGLKTVGWYYNVTSVQCRKTIFGCAFTNGNKFPDKEKCISFCKGVLPPVLSSLPKGQRFFFDTASRTCLAFHYNGARGNRNRFDTRKDCKCTCLQTNCG